MPGPLIQGTFTTGPTGSGVGNFSDVLDVPQGITAMILTLTGLDGSNTVKTQKNTTAGGAWVDQVTYNSNQSLVSIPVTNLEQWRLAVVSQGALKDIRYKMSIEAINV